MSDDNKLPVKIELGAKAEAKLNVEVKTEIPAEVTGNLISALTDFIRPWTEPRGLKADQVRLQRADIALEIAKKAQQLLAITNSEPRQLPLKFLIPLLEKASLEDMDTELRGAWAALLASASKSEDARQVTFVDIMSRLSSQELALLEKVCFADDLFPEKSYPNSHIEENESIVKHHAPLLEVDITDSQQGMEAVDKFVSACRFSYAELMHVTVGGKGGSIYFYFDAGKPGMPRFISLEFLRRERLVEFERIQFFEGVEIAYFYVTHLGIDFVRFCSPRADEVAEQKRKKNEKTA
jgi:Abortive infection alpha